MRNAKWCLIFLATALLVPASAFGIVLDEPLPTCSASFCDGSVARCNEGCRTPSGQLSQCRYFITDYDRDGVPNSSDNCDCHKNANQANCDGDSLGDACDGTDNSWTLTSTSTVTCHVDEDRHALWDTLELWSKKLYYSSCTGVTCVDKYLKKDFKCWLPGGATVSCCNNKSGNDPACGGAWNIDSCGAPACPF